MNVSTLVTLVWLAVGLVATAGRPAAAAPAARNVWACPMEDSAPSVAPGRCPVCGMKRVQRPRQPGDEARMKAVKADAGGPARPVAPGPREGGALYHCPMHPQIVQKKPGECPICLMQLVPIKQGDVRVPIAGRAVVKLDAGRRRQLGVVTERVRTRPLVHTLRLPGRVAHDPDLYAALTEYRAAAEAAGRTAGGATGPLASVLESAQLKLAHYGIDEAQAGALAAAGHVRHLILPGDHVWVHASAFEQDLPWLRRGQAATVEVSALPGRSLAGQVEAIEPSLDPVSRTATVRILVENPAGSAMRLEMFATVRIAAGLGNGLVVSRNAVLDTGERKIVFVVRGDELEPREIVTGVRVDDGIEVRRGLRDGDTVVTSGNFLIDADSQIRAAVAEQARGMEGGGPPTGNPPAGGHEGHGR